MTFLCFIYFILWLLYSTPMIPLSFILFSFRWIFPPLFSFLLFTLSSYSRLCILINSTFYCIFTISHPPNLLIATAGSPLPLFPSSGFKSLFLSHTLSLSYFVSLCLFYTHSHKHIHTQKYLHTLSLSLSHTHTHSQSHSHTHTLSLRHVGSSKSSTCKQRGICFYTLHRFMAIRFFPLWTSDRSLIDIQ